MINVHLKRNYKKYFKEQSISLLEFFIDFKKYEFYKTDYDSFEFLLKKTISRLVCINFSYFTQFLKQMIQKYNTLTGKDFNIQEKIEESKKILEKLQELCNLSKEIVTNFKQIFEAIKQRKWNDLCNILKDLAIDIFHFLIEFIFEVVEPIKEMAKSFKDYIKNILELDKDFILERKIYPELYLIFDIFFNSDEIEDLKYFLDNLFEKYFKEEEE